MVWSACLYLAIWSRMAKLRKEPTSQFGMVGRLVGTKGLDGDQFNPGAVCEARGIQSWDAAYTHTRKRENKTLLSRNVNQ